MTMTTCFIFLFSFSSLSRALAQDRAPHGLAQQNPVALSPSAYEFFNPNARQGPCATSNCSPPPLTAQVHETESQEVVQTTKAKDSSHSFRAARWFGPLFGILVVAFLAMGAYYMEKSRRADSSHSKAVQPNV